MSKRTPGPWIVSGNRDSDEFTVIQETSGATICSIEQTFGFAEADIANSRLIAAAPDLYEACKALRDYLQAASVTSTDIKTLHANLDAAIQKAEGAQ